MAVAEWLAHWLHMQEVQGSNPGLGIYSFSCQMPRNLTKIGFVAWQLLNFPSDFQQIHFRGETFLNKAASISRHCYFHIVYLQFQFSWCVFSFLLFSVSVYVRLWNRRKSVFISSVVVSHQVLKGVKLIELLFRKIYMYVTD